MMGIYSLIVGVFLLDLLGLSVIIQNLYLLFLAIAVIYLIYKTFRKSDNKFSVHGKFPRTDILVIVFCVLVSLIPAAISRSVLPFPYGTIETISIPFEHYQPALRFIEYGYLQHYRLYDYASLAISSQLFNIDSLSFIWSASFLMMAIFSFGLYLFSFSISKNKSFALLTVFVGSFLNMNIFRDVPLLFRANVFLYVFLPFALYLSHKNISRKEYRIRDVISTLILISAIILLFVFLVESNVWLAFAPKDVPYIIGEWRSHVWLPTILLMTVPILFVVGYFSRFLSKRNNFLSDNTPLLLFILFFYLIFLNSEAIAFILFTVAFTLLYFLSKNKSTRLLLYVFIALVFFFVLFQNYIIELNTFNPVSSIILPQFASSLDSISFSSRFSWLFEQNLTPLMNVLLIFGIAMCIVNNKQRNFFVLSAFSLALFLYFFPEVFAYRFFKEVTPLMAYLISFGLWRIFEVLDLRKRYSKLIFSTLIILLLLPSLIVPVYQRYYHSSLGDHIVSAEEYSVSKWLRENTPVNTLLISDYVTMQLMSPLSNKMLPTPRSYRIEALSQNDKQTIWRIKDMLSTSLSDYPLENVTQNQFWGTYKYKKGTVDIQIEPTIQKSETNATRLRTIEGNMSSVGAIHEFEAQQNWSNASAFYLNWYGGNTTTNWQIFSGAPNDVNWFAFDFTDNFIGWKKITIQLSDFDEVGSPNWGNVTYIAIRSSDANPNNSWLIGEVGLSYTESLNLSYDDFQCLIENMGSTDKRFCEHNGISLDNITVLTVVTSRTVQWVEQSDISEIWSLPQGPVDPNYLKFFNDSSFLELVYSYEDKIYVFKVKCVE